MLLWEVPDPRGPDPERQGKEWQCWSWRESGGLEAWCLPFRPGINPYCPAVAYNQTLLSSTFYSCRLRTTFTKCFPRHKDNISIRVMWFSKFLPTLFGFIFCMYSWVIFWGPLEIRCFSRCPRLWRGQDGAMFWQKTDNEQVNTQENNLIPERMDDVKKHKRYDRGSAGWLTQGSHNEEAVSKEVRFGLSSVWTSFHLTARSLSLLLTQLRFSPLLQRNCKRALPCLSFTCISCTLHSLMSDRRTPVEKH